MKVEVETLRRPGVVITLSYEEVFQLLEEARIWVWNVSQFTRPAPDPIMVRINKEVRGLISS